MFTLINTSSHNPQNHQLIYPSLAQCFANSLAIAVQTLGFAPSHENLPIHIEAAPNVGGYRSAIALTFSPPDKAKLARELGAIAQTYLDATVHNSSSQQAFILTSQSNGWLSLQCSLELQLTFINHIANHSSRLSPRPVTAPLSNSLNNDTLFELQYAHARCSSQLRLAKSHFTPDPLPEADAIASWLSTYFTLDHSKSLIERELWLRLLNFPNELHPQKKLMSNVQDFPSLPHPNPALLITPRVELPIPSKRILSLSQDWVSLFQKFYSHCRLVEILQSEQRHLLALRLSLFAGLKAIFNFILTDLVGISAPQFL